MVNSLRSYIERELAAHYSREQITSVLLRYHYSPQQIDAAFDGLDATPAKPSAGHPRSIAVLVAVLFTVALLIGGGVWFFLGEKAGEVLSLSVDVRESELQQGDNLRFGYVVASEKRVPASLRFEVYTLQDRLVTSSTDSFEVSGSVQREKTISLLGDLAPGPYYVRVRATHKESSTVATGNFRIAEVQEGIQDPVIERCPSRCDDGDSCTRDSCGFETGFRCVYESITPCCGDGQCSGGETFESCLKDCDAPAAADSKDLFDGKSIFEEIDTIAGVAKRDVNKAVRLCKDIEVLTYQHRCLTNVGVAGSNVAACEEIRDDPSKENCYFDYAVGTRDKEQCAKITKESRRDQCYMDFVTKGDYSVCDQLTNRYLKQSCSSMKQLAALNLEGITGDDLVALQQQIAASQPNHFADFFGLE